MKGEKKESNKDKKKILIYGAGNNLIYSFIDLNKCYQIVEILDGDSQKNGQKIWGYTVKEKEYALKCEYDFIVVTPVNTQGIKESLIGMGLDQNRIKSLQEALDRIPEDLWDSRNDIDDKEKVQDIAVVMCGGMGDLLIGWVWLECVVQRYQIDRKTIDMFLPKGLMDDGIYIYKDTVPRENIHAIDTYNEGFFGRKEYDTVLRFCIVPEVWYKRSKSVIGKEGGFDEYINSLWLFGKKNYNRGFIAASGFSKTIKRIMVDLPNVKYHTAFDVFGDLSEFAEKVEFRINDATRDTYLREVGLSGRRYITLNTGLNDEYRNKKNTRAWSLEKWSVLAKRLKKEYPDIVVVQVGTRMRDEDDIPADVHMNGQTTLEQITYILEEAVLHVDYDGGLVHVRHLSGGKSIVLMGSSSAKKHEYPENTYIQTDKCEPCEWNCPEWLSVCSQGYESPLCMESITVDMVMEVIRRAMEEV